MKKFIQVIIFILLIVAFIYLGQKDYKTSIKNNKKSEIPSDRLIDNDTVFIETNHSKILSKMSSKNDFILYACIDENKLCTKYGLLIDEVAKEYNISDIFYYDFKDDRENNNGTYQKIIGIFFKNGLVYSYDDSLSQVRGEYNIDTVWNEETINLKRTYLSGVMEEFSKHE